MLLIAAAHSLSADTEISSRYLAQGIVDQLAGYPPSAGLLLAGANIDPVALIRRLVAHFPNFSLIGGLSQGEVSRHNGYRHGSALLIAFASDSIRIDTDIWRNPHTDTDNTSPADTSIPPRLLFLLSNPQTDHAALRLAAAVRYPQARLCILSCAAHANATAPIFHHDQPFVGAAVGLVFRGPLRFAWGLAAGLNAGWQPLGQPMTALIEDRCILCLDQRPAAQSLRQAHPAWPGANPLLPLALHGINLCDPVALQPIQAIDTDSGALHLSTTPPCQTSCAQLTEPDPGALQRAARCAMQQALTHYPDLSEPAAALWFSTRLRALAMDGHPAGEYQAAVSRLTPCLTVAGGYGEHLSFSTETKYVEASPYAQLVLLLGEEPCPRDDHAQDQLRASQMQRLREELALARQRLTELEPLYQREETLTRIGANIRSEQHYFHRALALEILCGLIDQRFDDLRRHALIGDPPRLNRSGLARLIRREYQVRTGQEFPLQEGALGRLLGRKSVLKS